MWDEILPLAEKKSPVSPATPEVKKPVTVKDSKSLHDEIKEKLVAIGELLGFDSRSEVKITTGAVVDAVWEAKIGNMGKAIYVFEVQSKGSIDSLILNLKKAQSNAAVQAVVAVADEEQLAKIIRESAGVIDEKSLRTWDSEDVLAVYDSLVRAHESIFAEQFGVIAVHLPKYILGQFFGKLCHIMIAIPSSWCGIELGVNGSLLKVRPNILFLNFIAPSFLARSLAGHLAAFE